ncbi:MAG TPA: ATP-binding protein [Chitinophagaceae bacterium]|nr:ATP-binding protein [Chitinophagaceae bacterium]
MCYRKYHIVLIITLFPVFVNAQTRTIDSLRKKLWVSEKESYRLGILLSLCEEYQSLNRDTLYAYAIEARDLAAAQKNKKQVSLAALALANAYMQWGWVDSALASIEPEIPLNPVTDPTTRDTYFKLTRQKAMCYGNKSDFEKALAIFFPLLSEAEIYKDTLNMGGIMNTVGSIAIARGEPAEALKWINKAITFSIAGPKYFPVLAAVYVNAANAYNQIEKTDSAFYFIQKSIPICRKLENLNYLATALRVQTSLMTKKGRLDEAEASLKEMISIRRLTSVGEFFVDDNLQLADFYANTGQLDKAIAFCKKQLQTGNVYDTAAKESATFTNDPKMRLAYFQALSKYYKQAGMYPEYQETLEQIIAAKDSFYVANSAQAIADAEAKYEVQKKENTILQQKYGLQRKNFFIYGAFGLLALALITVYFIFRDYRRRQRLKMTLALAEEKRITINAVKAAEEKERVRIAADLHDNLGAYAASLSSNLGYIQPLDKESAMSNAFRELNNNSNAIISELNDTIWVLKKEALSLTAISDRIKVFISRIQKSYPDLHIEVEEQVKTDHQLPSSQAFHLYRVLQEAINNALKHSKGKNIKVKITGDNNWNVSVADDGTGIDLSNESAGGGGNGLNNMKERCKEAGWEISWQKTDSGGTIVKISPTTN